MSKTNIKKWHRDLTKPILDSWQHEACLVSCFVDGEPSVALALVEKRGDDYIICPKFVAVTDKMVVTDHDGIATSQP